MKLFTLLVIPVRLHWSFLALLGLFVVGDLITGGLMGMVYTLGLAFALFGSVLLHEFGHAIAARAYGIRTDNITLYPFGGVAAIKDLPRTPGQELVIALAGPLVNAVLVALAVTGALFTGSQSLLVVAGLNLIMGLFNLLPAFPMDGGRALRALLSPSMGARRASELAIGIGKAFAIVFVIGGLVSGQFSLALVGGFLLFALRIEKHRLVMSQVLGRRIYPGWRQQRPQPAGSWRVDPPRR